MAALTHPAVDVVTERAAVILQERPVVPLTTWITDAIVMATTSGRAVQVVTPSSSRLTFALAETLRRLDGQWVVPDGGGYYDGLRGHRLAWDGSRFARIEGAAPPAGTITGGTTRLDITVIHPATEELRLGLLADLCVRSLTGSSPRGWGVAEPAAQPWSVNEITAYCRGRAPEPSTLVVVGANAAGLLRVGRRPSGVVERLTLAVGSADAPDLDALDRLAVDLAGAEAATVRTMLASLRPGRSDVTEEPRFNGWPIPYGMLVGPEPVAEFGVMHARAAPAPHVLLTGPATRPLVWCRFGAPADLAAVLTHFGAIRPTTGGGGLAADRAPVASTKMREDLHRR